MTNFDPTGRHPATIAALARLEPNPNLPADAQTIAQHIYDLAVSIVNSLPDDPDLSDGLRKLWEGKNCFVYLSVKPPHEHQPGEPW